VGTHEARVQGGDAVDFTACDQLDDAGVLCSAQDRRLVPQTLGVVGPRGPLAGEHSAALLDCGGDSGAHEFESVRKILEVVEMQIALDGEYLSVDHGRQR
jgi:hypothetical protein